MNCLMMNLSQRALATPVTMLITSAQKPRPLPKRKPSRPLAAPRSHSAAMTATTPSQCQRLSLSPKRIIEKSTTNIGLEALKVLTVVIGRSLSASIPESQVMHTITAFTAMRR